MNKSVKDIVAEDIKGNSVNFNSFEGKVLLIVNVASQCGLTPQYEGLEKIYKKYKEQGLEILGFPANEFLAQEPGSNEEIADFCTSNYGVDFHMFSKIIVKGSGQHPLYERLTRAIPKAEEKPDGKLKELLRQKGLLSGDEHDISWNFEKFLINRKGEVVGRFSPEVAPEDEMLVSAIEKELKN